VTQVVPGHRFGRLTVLRDSGQRKWGQVAWVCQCSCGGPEVNVASRNLTSGRTQSCGCLLRDVLRQRNTKNSWHDLRTEISDVAATQRLVVTAENNEIGWNSTVLVLNPLCGHNRRTNVSEFLKNPTACRRCSKRMPADKLATLLSPRGINLKTIKYGTVGTPSIAFCQCNVCGEEFSRTVGALASGNRGCPGCYNIQERYVRVILTENFGGAFQIRVRPKWMEGLELDGLNEEVVIDGKAIAFEYNGKYWHRKDKGDRSTSDKKRDLCARHGVLLFVVWAPADRPSIEELIVACQAAVDMTGVNRRLDPPSNSAAVDLARLVPAKIKNLLSSYGHEAIEYDQNPERRGYVVSRCILSGEIVSRALHTLDKLKGCRHCRAHPSRADQRRAAASYAAKTFWSNLRDYGGKRLKDKITDEIVAFVRENPSITGPALTGEVLTRFGVQVSESGLQYARSGKTHSHLNELYPPVRKAASNYTLNDPMVKVARELRATGLSFRKISDRLFELGHTTLSGKRFSATQVKNFCSRLETVAAL
jgi:hypothetical protein